MLLNTYRFLFFVLILSSPAIVRAQNFVNYENTVNHQEIWTVSFPPAPNAINTNYILIEIAKGLQKTPSAIRLQLDARIKNRLISNGDKSYLAFCELSNILMSGDIWYRGFDISNTLKPDIYSLELQIQNLKSRQTWVFITTNKPLSLSDGHARLSEHALNDTMNASYEMTISKLNFYHSAEGIKNFDEITRLIDDYFLSEIQLKQALQKVQTINTANVDMIPLYDFQLRDAEIIISKLESQQYPLRLNLGNNDPVNFLPRFNDLKNQVIQTRNQLNQLLSSLDRIYYEKGIEYLQSNDAAAANNYFNKALQINPFFTPAYYQQARMYFLAGRLQEAADIVNRVLSSMKPDNNTYIALLALGNDILRQYLLSGEDLMSREKFPEAILLLQNGKVFCSTTPGIICPDEIQRAYARAKYGMYEGYLTIARRALDNNKPKLAENYVYEAWKYQLQNSAEIIMATEAFGLYNAIASAYMKNGQDKLSQKKYSQALIDFASAERICELNNDIPRPEKLDYFINQAHKGVYDNKVAEAWEMYKMSNTIEAESKVNEAEKYRLAHPAAIAGSSATDSLMAKIRFQTYKEYIYRGEQYLGFNEHETALIWLEKARELELLYPLTRNTKLPEMIQKAGKTVLLKNISDAGIKVWGNMLEEASQLTGKIIDDQQKYLLEDDAEINSKLKELKEKIFSKDCLNLQKEHEDQLQLARQNINQLDYITGFACYNKAIEIAESKPACKINTNFSKEMTERYAPAANFQVMMKSLQQAIDNDRFNDIFSLYSKATVQFDTFQLQKYALKLPPLFDIFYTSTNSRAIAWYADQCIDSGEPAKSLSLLKRLKDRNYPLGNTRQLQEKLGAALARSDKNMILSQNPKIQAVSHVGEDKYFRFFTKAYINEWNSYKPETTPN